ncbi:MAG: helix-turn-helix domain-containing protein [Psychromonas sp.]|nr:helix-turn-helix domain-containing protein [Psychromonas sp.]
MIKLFEHNKRGMSQTKIALRSGVNQSSISRELKRNIGNRSYSVMQVKDKTIKRLKNSISYEVMKL